MSKTDNTVLKDMVITMLLYGIIAQIDMSDYPRGSSENDRQGFGSGWLQVFSW